MTRRPHLLVIDPSIVWPEDEGVREIVGDWPGGHTVLRPALRSGDSPSADDGRDVQTVVVMGSRASVNDDAAWLRALGEWLEPVLDGRCVVPTLGICFGHQLIAARAGGRVGPIRPDRTEERGVVPTLFTSSRLVPGGGRLQVIVSHGEEVKSVPSGYRVVASRDGVPVDALEHERLPIVSVQFHPEARGSFLRLRGIAAGRDDEAAFADQARVLAAFRAYALAFTSAKGTA